MNKIDKGMHAFTFIWVGQFVSLIGSGLTGFALGVWVYLNTKSVTQFSIIFLATAVPGILMSPVTGALVDRWDRRKAMIFSDAGAAFCTLAIALLFYTGLLRIWHIYVLMAVSSAFSSFQWPAYSAATSLLVPKKHLGRAAGMVQTAEAASLIVSPVLAGMLLVIIDVWGVIAVDFATFLVAISTLLVVRVPRPEKAITSDKPSLLREATYGWTYIKARPGLLSLLIFFAVSNFLSGFANVLLGPLVLSFTSPPVLGTILSAGGVGMLVGGVVMSAWGGPKKRIHGILGLSLVSGAAMAIGGMRPSAPLLAAAFFVALFTSPIVNGCSQAIWQTKTAPDVQGRVFSVRRMIAWSTSPLSFLMAGPLADKVFEPLLAVNGPLAQSVGSVIGVGPGRGIGLMFIVMGVLSIGAVIAGYLYPRLRFVEDELGDAIIDRTAAVSVS